MRPCLDIARHMLIRVLSSGVAPAHTGTRSPCTFSNAQAA